MIDLTINQHDLRKINRALQQLPWRVSGNITKDATYAGAKVIQRYARQYAPYLSGRLEKAIVIKRSFRSRTRVNFAIGVNKKASYYGKSLELGGTYRIKNGVRHQPAMPFLRPAIRNHRREIIDTVSLDLRRGIEREAARLR